VKRIPHIRIFVLLSVAALLFAGALPCAAQEPPVNAEPQAGYVPGLLPGDQIEVYSTDLTEAPDVKLTIGPDGTINFPYIGTVKLEGLTPAEVQTKIAEQLKLKQIVLSPTITVNVVNARNYAVTVLGEVRTPMRIPLFSAEPLSIILSAAGGLTSNASLHILISHADGSVPEDVEVSRDLHDLHTLNATVLPGDVVAVVPAGSFFALGEFNKPGVYPIVGTQHLTLLQAVVAAGGPTPIGYYSKTRLLRTVNGHREEIFLDVGKLERGEIADPLVHTDDILYIPRNNTKNLTNNWLNTTLMLTGLGLSLANFLK
jgi:polysaccharide export outer membrane protein